MNTKLLKAFMARNGDTQADLAMVLGISASRMNAKINGKAEFWSSEIGLLKERYDMSADDVDIVFFTDKVS